MSATCVFCSLFLSAVMWLAIYEFVERYVP